MEDDGVPEAERLQMQQIRELEFEELQVEEVEGHHNSDEDDTDRFNFVSGAGASGQVPFDICLASLHTYLGEVEDTRHRLVCLDSGSTVSLPLLYLEGVVLFPEATLPLRVVQPNYVAAVRRALDQAYIIGVARVYRDEDDGNIRFSNIGTTAEIQQYRVLGDGSLNVVTRGRQRFSLRRRWIDVDGMPCGEVQIIQEDLPLRTPRDAFGKLPSRSTFRSRSFSLTPPANGSRDQDGCEEEDKGSEAISEESFESELSPSEIRMHQSAVHCSYEFSTTDESSSSDEDKLVCESEHQLGMLPPSGSSLGSSHSDHGKRNENDDLRTPERSISKRRSYKGERQTHDMRAVKVNRSQGVPRAFWPYWVYRMLDSYSLAQRAADMWKKIVRAPSMDGLVMKPDLLSFYIASKIPVSESKRQELLEINGVSYRLRQEIKLLESFDCVRCKNCQIVIARRSDMLVMSSEGPLGAYVNPHGFVHELMTFHRATGLALVGTPTKEYSWFPGYSWTIANCASCESHMGWLFRRADRMLKPRLFWGIRNSQVANNMH